MKETENWVEKQRNSDINISLNKCMNVKSKQKNGNFSHFMQLFLHKLIFLSF